MQQSAKQDQTRAAGNWLAVEIDKMRKKVAEAEAKVEEYRVKSNLFVGSNNTSLPNQQLTEINSQISAARGQKADLEARARQLRDQVRSGKPVESSDIANSESMRRLVEQRVALRSQLAEQSSTLLDQHPRIKELKAQIAEVDRQIKVEGERLARQLDNDAAVAGNRLESLTASLDQVKKLASQKQRAGRAVARARTRGQDPARPARILSGEISRGLRARQHQCRAAGGAHHFARHARHQAGLSEETADGADRGLCRLRIVGGLHRDRRAAGAGAVVLVCLWLRARRLRRAGIRTAGKACDGAAAAAHGLAAFGAGRRFGGRSLRPCHCRSARWSRSPAICGLPAMPAAASPWSAPCAMSAPPMPRSRWRALAKDANVVLVDLAFGAPNLSVISTDPKAPGIAELVRGTASFGDIITRDQYSNVHLVATGNVGNDGAALAASPMLATVIEALVRSYDHVVIDVGSAADVAVERFAPLAPRAVLVAADPANPATRAARERLMMAGFADVTLLAGIAQAVAA